MRAQQIVDQIHFNGQKLFGRSFHRILLDVITLEKALALRVERPQIFLWRQVQNHMEYRSSPMQFGCPSIRTCTTDPAPQCPSGLAK